jgi:hypothetical protein
LRRPSTTSSPLLSPHGASRFIARAAKEVKQHPRHIHPLSWVKDEPT